MELWWTWRTLCSVVRKGEELRFTRKEEEEFRFIGREEEEEEEYPCNMVNIVIIGLGLRELGENTHEIWRKYPWNRVNLVKIYMHLFGITTLFTEISHVDDFILWMHEEFRNNIYKRKEEYL